MRIVVATSGIKITPFPSLAFRSRPNNKFSNDLTAPPTQIFIFNILRITVEKIVKLTQFGESRIH